MKMRAWFPCVLHLPVRRTGGSAGTVLAAAETTRPNCSDVPAATGKLFAALCASLCANRIVDAKALSYAEHACPVRRAVPCRACSRACRQLARSVIIRASLFPHRYSCLTLFSLSPSPPPFLSPLSQKLSRASVLPWTSHRRFLSSFLSNVPSQISAICFLRVACFVSSAPGLNWIRNISTAHADKWAAHTQEAKFKSSHNWIFMEKSGWRSLSHFLQFDYFAVRARFRRVRPPPSCKIFSPLPLFIFCFDSPQPPPGRCPTQDVFDVLMKLVC